jgi:hypothetical protein
MPDLRLFSSEKYSIRASRLYWFMCQMRHALDHLGFFAEDAGGVAAQTGSLTHAAVCWRCSPCSTAGWPGPPSSGG